MKSIIKLVRNNIVMLKASHMLKVVFLVFFIAVTLLSVFFRLTIKSVNRLELFSEVIGIFGGIILIILAFLSLYLIFYPKILNLEQLFLTRPITKKVYFVSKILVSLIILILLIFILTFVSYGILLTGTSYFWQGEAIATLLIKIANVSLVGLFLIAIIYFTSALCSSIYLNFAIFFIIYLGGEILKKNIYSDIYPPSLSAYTPFGLLKLDYSYQLGYLGIYAIQVLLIIVFSSILLFISILCSDRRTY